MKKIFLVIIGLGVILNFSNCKKDESGPSNDVSYDVLFYQSNTSSKDNKSDMLQATIKKSDMQFSTFGDMNTGTLLGSFKKAYVYNEAEKTESFMLMDDLGEPAFLYKVDLVSGKKKEAVVEFIRESENTFYVRFFHYDWTNRLGTLLFETLITKSGSEYTSTPTFEIEDLNFGTKNSSELKKGNRAFPVKLTRFSKMLSPMYNSATLKSTNEGLDGWKESFDNLKNSDIGDWLSTTRKAGVALTLIGLGATETLVGAPAGAWLIAGGAALVTVSTAIEIVVTDKWSDFLTETKDKIETLSETVTEVAGNMVQKFDGYAQNLKDHWANSNINKTDLDELIEDIEKNEIIILNEDLDDLPDKNGVLQIGLSWDTNGTDIDLWVTDPSGEKIYYAHPTSASEGYLDRDDTDGFGPENIYWVNNIPDGNYLVQADYFAGMEVTNYVVKVTNGLGYSATYNGTLTTVGQVDDVVTISKNGSTIGD